jgi:hypothetical protein
VAYFSSTFKVRSGFDPRHFYTLFVFMHIQGYPFILPCNPFFLSGLSNNLVTTFFSMACFFVDVIVNLSTLAKHAFFHIHHGVSMDFANLRDKGSDGSIFPRARRGDKFPM